MPPDYEKSSDYGGSDPTWRVLVVSVVVIILLGAFFIYLL